MSWRERLFAVRSAAETPPKESTKRRSARSASFVKFVLLNLFAFANVASAHFEDGPSLSSVVSQNSISVVTVAGVFIILLILFAVVRTEPSEIFKGVIFFLIALAALGATLYLSASTVYLNMKSESGGPVHWHADFRIFNCAQEVFLQKPKGLSNRIGRTDLHEHGDGRIHIEGVVVERKYFSLREFFEAIGGTLEAGELAFPSEDNFEWMVNGQKCPDGKPARIQAFLYKTEGKIIRQEKLDNFMDYVPSPHSQVPPGDCLILEFGEEKEKTENICNFTQIAINNGDYSYEK